MKIFIQRIGSLDHSELQHYLSKSVIIHNGINHIYGLELPPHKTVRFELWKNKRRSYYSQQDIILRRTVALFSRE